VSINLRTERRYLALQFTARFGIELGVDLDGGIDHIHPYKDDREGDETADDRRCDERERGTDENSSDGNRDRLGFRERDRVGLGVCLAHLITLGFEFLTSGLLVFQLGSLRFEITTLVLDLGRKRLHAIRTD